MMFTLLLWCPYLVIQRIYPLYFSLPAGTGKINDPLLPGPNNIKWHLQRAKKQRLKHCNFQRSAICEFRGNAAWIEKRKKQHIQRLNIAFISQMWVFDKETTNL